MIDFEISSGDLQRLVLDLVATEAQAKKALNSTLRKMATWLKTRSLKGLSKTLQIQQKVMRRRLKSFRLKSTATGSSITIFYGLNPVALIYLQAKKGGGGIVASGGRSVSGGFIAKTPGGGQQVFKRIGSARLPIAKQSADVQEPSENYLEHQLDAAAFEAQFFKTFEHELQWQTRIRQ
jgi:hypothetical protein